VLPSPTLMRRSAAVGSRTPWSTYMRLRVRLGMDLTLERFHRLAQTVRSGRPAPVGRFLGWMTLPCRGCSPF
jgi:hypothetical protein